MRLEAVNLRTLYAKITKIGSSWIKLEKKTQRTFLETHGTLKRSNSLLKVKDITKYRMT